MSKNAKKAKIKSLATEQSEAVIEGELAYWDTLDEDDEE